MLDFIWFPQQKFQNTRANRKLLLLLAAASDHTPIARKLNASHIPQHHFSENCLRRASNLWSPAETWFMTIILPSLHLFPSWLPVCWFYCCVRKTAGKLRDSSRNANPAKTTVWDTWHPNPLLSLISCWGTDFCKETVVISLTGETTGFKAVISSKLQGSLTYKTISRLISTPFFQTHTACNTPICPVCPGTSSHFCFHILCP